MKILMSILTGGMVGNELMLWAMRNVKHDLTIGIINEKPRERARMEAMSHFLKQDYDWWMLTNHYTNPQFSIEDVPFDRPCFSAYMKRPMPNGIEPLAPPYLGKEISSSDNWIQTTYMPDGCMFLRRDAVEAIADKRPFKFQYNNDGRVLEKSCDATMSETLINEGFKLWIWKKRCFVKQQVWI